MRCHTGRTESAILCEDAGWQMDAMLIKYAARLHGAGLA
jgi:hypothetical protein